MLILLLADIHGNFPALRAIDEAFSAVTFDAVVNCGDSVVYAPFANEVITWLIAREAVSILGNTDKLVLKLLRGKDFAKPAKGDKRVMYEHTARQLTRRNAAWLMSRPISAALDLPLPGSEDPRQQQLGIFHGSPAKPHEFLFDTTPHERFVELATAFPYRVIVTGHSHTPYHYQLGNSHFINPGSVGRMFDGNPAVSCAVLQVGESGIAVTHHRLAYDVSQVTSELARQRLPEIYQTMYRQGRKLN